MENNNEDITETSKGGGMKALFMVMNAGFANDVLDSAREVGVQGATIFNARGEGAHLESILGVTIDTEKDLVLCLTDEATAEKAMAIVKEKFGVKTPAHSICFTMPVDSFVGVATDK